MNIDVSSHYTQSAQKIAKATETSVKSSNVSVELTQQNGRADDNVTVERGDRVNHSTTASNDSGRTDADRVKDTVVRLNEHVQQMHRELQFSVDDDTGKTVVKVINRDTDEVIRQIPAEELLEMAKRLDESDPFGFISESA